MQCCLCCGLWDPEKGTEGGRKGGRAKGEMCRVGKTSEHGQAVCAHFLYRRARKTHKEGEA